ncbi:TOMM precursor leader peptide-binding protein [Streptomyces sp. PTY087I2]|uniref:TOMM precursor leader peptide-binding protein n=1 Tax=Streptomyces sp. PTY087I2 TaxID=1819298 RepID=UPI002100463E|nr:TOMM precursor leader peptide-binding protein [Streptomyces sp. PTY087I2]
MREQAGPVPGGGTPRIGWRAHLRSVVVPGEAVYLVSDRGVRAVRGPAAEALAPLLDGTRTPEEVLRLAAGNAAVSADELRRPLSELWAAGLLRARSPEAPPSSDSSADAFWDLTGAAPPTGPAVRLVVLGGPVGHAQAAAACTESGLTVAPSDAAEAEVTLVLCADYLEPRLADIDARLRAAGRPWILAKPGGPAPWTGPVFRPGDGPCWHCLAERLRLHRGSEEPLNRALGSTGPVDRPDASLAASRALGLHTAVLETARYLAGTPGPAHDSVHVLDALTLTAEQHPVVRRPQCPACGDPGLVGALVRAPFVTEPRPKAAAGGGNGHRSMTPRQMLESYGHLVSPVTGVVREVLRDPRSPDFTHSYLSGHNPALRAQTLAGHTAGLRALSGGKGLTSEEARVSALCEAVERYSGTRHGDEPVVRDSLRSLGAAAVHPDAVRLHDARQLRDRDAWNAARSPFQYVGLPFDEDAVLDWTPVWSLTEGRQRLLPTSLLYYDPDPAAPLRADSNGNAAGSSLEDAFVQGFLELVERDAVALWWYNRTLAPALDLDAFAASGEDWIEPLRAGYRSVGREVWALDLTSDFGIPVVAALSRRTEGAAEDVLFGFGAHLDPRVAVRRALTEMGQLLPAVIGACPDGTGYTVDDPQALSWWRTAVVADQPHLLPDPKVRPTVPGDHELRFRDDLAEDVAALTELAAERRLDVLVLDQTRPDIGLPVVKVIIPGMRHFWPRFAPGRLFDVPVALGRLAEPTAYEHLNPVPLFM